MTENQDIRSSADDAEPQRETAVVAEVETEVGAEIETDPVTGVQTETVAEVETGTVAATQTEAAISAATETAEDVPATPRRRISGGRLFTAALAIGLLGGVGAGYAVQATRPPTPLPPLAATQPKYPPVGVYQGMAPPMLPASQDDATRTEGDLASLLLPAPAGASTVDGDGWVDQDIGVLDDADLCTTPTDCFTNDLSSGVVALADTSWVTSSGFYVEIRLLRYAPGDSNSARVNVQQADGGEGSNTIALPPDLEDNGYELYDSSQGGNEDQAFAVHGDIEALFWVTSATKVPNPSLIDSVMTQQMGRL